MGSDRDGVRVRFTAGEVSDPCDRGHHEDCSGATASPASTSHSRIVGVVTIHYCGCWMCGCRDGVDLEAVAETVRNRARALGV